MAPGVPELREAMQEEHGWAGHRAGGGDVEFYAVGLNGSVADGVHWIVCLGIG